MKKVLIIAAGLMMCAGGYYLALSWLPSEPDILAEDVVVSEAEDIAESAHGSPEKVKLSEAQASDPKGPCSQMLALLKSCQKGRPARPNSGFDRAFLANCRKEIARATEYAAGFRACASSVDCKQLADCSNRLKGSIMQLGARHVRYLMQNNSRPEAKKFCWDNRDVATRAVEFDQACHNLIEEVAKERGASHSCPFHDH